MIEFVARNLL